MYQREEQGLYLSIQNFVFYLKNRYDIDDKLNKIYLAESFVIVFSRTLFLPLIISRALFLPLIISRTLFLPLIISRTLFLARYFFL